jgi:hypothetical protein
MSCPKTSVAAQTGTDNRARLESPKKLRGIDEIVEPATILQVFTKYEFLLFTGEGNRAVASLTRGRPREAFLRTCRQPDATVVYRRKEAFPNREPDPTSLLKGASQHVPREQIATNR